MTVSTSYGFGNGGLVASSVTSVSRSAGIQNGSTIVGTGNGNSVTFYWDAAAGEIAARTISAAGTIGARVAISVGSVSTSLAGSGNIEPVSATRLANGNIVVAWTSDDAVKSVYLRVFDSNLTPVTSAILAEELGTNSGRPDIAALSGGGFVIAFENSNANGDPDIYYRRFDDGGTALDASSVGLAATADIDQRPSVAGLANGGFAIAWERQAANGDTAIWNAVRTAGGAPVLAPTLVDASGTINRDVEVAARIDGGYTLIYEDSQFSATGNTDFGIWNFNASGVSQGQIARNLIFTQNEGDLAAAVSPEGVIFAVNSLSFSATDRDLYGFVLDPSGSLGSTTNSNVVANQSAVDETVGSASWLDAATVRIVYSRNPGTAASGDSDASIHTGLLTVTRVSNGDSAADTMNFSASIMPNRADGGGGNDIIIGGIANDELTGGAGDDVLVGGAGNDTLNGESSFGGTGINTLQGGTGNDIFVVSNNQESVVEFANEGVDTVQSLALTYTLPGNVENLQRAIFAANSSLLFIGNELDNAITGYTTRDDLYGRDGNDILDDGGNNSGNADTLIGGLGNDIYVVRERGSSTVELAGEGVDEVRTAFSIYGLQANVENLTVTDIGIHAALVGNLLDNVITGNISSDDLFGREGNDTLIGGSTSANTMLGQEGDDLYISTATGDSIIEFANEGTDTVQASVSSFTLGANVENLIFSGANTARVGVGNDLANIVRGLGGADALNGLDGNDTVIGGSGADQLQGGAGADQFRYEGGETGLDRILDFVSGTDKIALSSAFFTPTGTVSFVSAVGAVATSSNSTILYDPSTGIVSYDDDGNGAGAAVQIAQLNGGQTFTAGDFLFY